MSEIPYHIPGSFPTGATVFVARSVPKAHAWHEYWTQDVESVVGQNVQIVGKSTIRGILIEKRGSVRGWVPSAALESLESKGPVVIEVPSCGGQR